MDFDCLFGSFLEFDLLACLLFFCLWIPLGLVALWTFTSVFTHCLFLLSLLPTLNKLQDMDSNTASTSSLQNTSPPMNPAEVSELQTAFAYQSEMLREYREQLEKLQSTNEYLTHYLRSLPPPAPQTVSFAMPDKFDGSADYCKGFIRQVEIFFDNQKDKFTDGKKFAF